MRFFDGEWLFVKPLLFNNSFLFKNFDSMLFSLLIDFNIRVKRVVIANNKVAFIDVRIRMMFMLIKISAVNLKLYSNLFAIS